jgi:hypothetical protein
MYSSYDLCFRTHFRRYRGQPVQFLCFPLSTRFQQYRGRRVQFSNFAHPDSLSAEPTGPVLMFFAPRFIFDGIEGVGSSFHGLRSQTRFQALGLVFMFCAPGPVFGGTKGVKSNFHVL